MSQIRANVEVLESHPARYWHKLEDGRLQCDLCPRFCKLHEGQRAFCFVRARQGDQIVLTTYGRSSGFCIDPVEKKALNHFLPDRLRHHRCDIDQRSIFVLAGTPLSLNASNATIGRFTAAP